MLLGLMFYAPPNTQLAGQQSVEPGQTRGSDQKRGGFVMSATRHRSGRAPAVGEPVPARFFPGLRLKIALLCERQRYHYLRAPCRRSATSWWSIAPTCTWIMTILRGCMAVTARPDCPAC